MTAGSHGWRLLIIRFIMCVLFFLFQAEDGIRALVRSRGLGDVYKRQLRHRGVQPARREDRAVPRQELPDQGPRDRGAARRMRDGCGAGSRRATRRKRCRRNSRARRSSNRSSEPAGTLSLIHI